jgi:hypothetical protein
MVKKLNRKNNVHYVNNQEFLAAMIEYRNAVQLAKSEDRQKPRVPNYLGECFVKIANHLAYKSNFINYTYREEMILDGIENCITYIDNFDPAKSSNPFAYFTQITYYAFLRRIQKEKKYTATKYRYIQNIDISQLITEDADGSEHTNEFINYLRKQIDEAYDGEQIDGAAKPVFKKRRPKYFDKEPENSLDIP